MLRHVHASRSAREIAEELGVSDANMRRHLEAIRNKLEATKQVRSVCATRDSSDPQAIQGAANSRESALARVCNCPNDRVNCPPRDGRRDAGSVEGEFGEV